VRDNFMSVKMANIPENVSLARIITTGFIAPLDPTVSETSDIKTAVSEAVTNAIIHGYENSDGEVELRIASIGRKITIEVSDHGVGIEDVQAVKQPMFTTKPEMERSGLGFTVMESFMDSVEIKSVRGEGTTVVLEKQLQ